MTKYITIAASIILLAGCGPKNFSTNGNQQQYYKDNSECMAMSQTDKGFGMASRISANMDQNQIYEQCMMGKGYRPDK